MRRKRQEPSAQLEELTKVLNTEQRKRTADDLYVWAVVRALRGEKEATLRSLEEAINAYSFRNFARMHRDVAFQPLLTNDPASSKRPWAISRSCRQGGKDQARGGRGRSDRTAGAAVHPGGARP